MLRLALVALASAPCAAAESERGEPVVVVTQLASGIRSGAAEPSYDGSRIVLVRAGSAARLLTAGLAGARDPEISFDGRRMLFSGRRQGTDPWNVFELGLDDGSLRQVTREAGNCRSPIYAGTIYTIDDDAPAEQIVFVSDLAGELEEHEAAVSTSLYSCRLDGSQVRRLTYNPSSDRDPVNLPDGRVVFASRLRARLDHGPGGRAPLFAAQSDGLDYAIFTGDGGRRFKRMPAVTADRTLVFVESDVDGFDRAGTLGAVHLRRNLHSYHRLTDERDGLFRSPAPLPDGGYLVARRPPEGDLGWAVWRIDPATGDRRPVFDDPSRDDVQASVVAPRPRPDGRSSVVVPDHPTGTLYCLDVHEPGGAGQTPARPNAPTRLRVLEGLPRRAADLDEETGRVAPVLERRVLGEIEVAADGSFQIEVPARIPIELQLLDSAGRPRSTCGWIWVRGRETRGCIGCHESGERTPPNRFVDALRQPSIPLTLPPERRRLASDFELGLSAAGADDGGVP